MHGCLRKNNILIFNRAASEMRKNLKTHLPRNNVLFKAKFKFSVNAQV